MRNTIKSVWIAAAVAGTMSVCAFGAAEYVYEDDNMKIGNYEGLVYNSVLEEVTDDAVEKEIQDTLNWYAEGEHLLEGEAADGDTVNIDYAGTIDGEAFDGGTAEDQTLTIGDGGYIDGFEDGIIGMKPGETKDINVTFPEDYGAENLAGKDAVFTITLNYIEGEEIIPELTEEFVKENFDVDTIDEYRDSVRADLEENAQTLFETEQQGQVTDGLMEICEVDNVDEDAVEKDMQEVIDQYQYYAGMYGMEYEDFLSSYGMDKESFEKELKEQATYFEKQNMILHKIAELENIEVTDEDVEAYLQEMADSYGYDSLDDLKSEMENEGFDPMEDSRDNLLLQKTKEWLVEHAAYDPDAFKTDAEGTEDAGDAEAEEDAEAAEETEAGEEAAAETEAAETTAEETTAEAAETTAEETTEKAAK